MAAGRLEYWFEFGSTYSHVSTQRIGLLARERGVSIAWRPFLLGPIFKAQGWNDSPFNVYPVKGAYMWRDMERLCAELDVPFRRPSVFPRNGLLAARVALLGETESWIQPFACGIFLANFHADEDIADPAVVRERLARAGCPDPDATLQAAQAPAHKARLRERTEDAVRRGIFGAPSFLVGDELFWGQDRLEAALAWADRS